MPDISGYILERVNAMAVSIFMFIVHSSHSRLLPCHAMLNCIVVRLGCMDIWSYIKWTPDITPEVMTVGLTGHQLHSWMYIVSFFAN